MRFHISTTRIDHESLYIGAHQSRTDNQAHHHAVLTPVGINNASRSGL